MPTMFALVRFLGLQGLLALAAFVFYEGIPAANYVTPYLRIVPAIGPMVDDLAQGRVGRARETGRLDERLVWQERQRRAELQRDAERKSAQAKINEVERDYLSRQSTDAIRISDLEKALEEEQTSSPAAGCGPAVSRKLRDAIDRIGRD
ncbi:hypothetical protein [Shinella sp.]|uniref:hypothetical protein n=1 Tax=Shinella sp. TaxID=1870904 RepID=UPI0029B75F29|nr:hypothetical protein [Shinella sp.]MDX3973316.1 hypothetical protein [Shinella sp.]